MCAEGTTPDELHPKLCLVQGCREISEGNIRKWYRAFETVCTYVHDRKCSGRYSILIDKIVEQVNRKVRNDRWFYLSALGDKFSHFGCTFFGTIVLKARISQILCRVCSKNANWLTQIKENMQWMSVSRP